MTEDRLRLPADLPIPTAADERAQAELAFALAHPRWIAVRPIANGALAVSLGAYSLAYLFALFAMVFAR